jgi:hypothetical protein
MREPSSAKKAATAASSLDFQAELEAVDQKQFARSRKV